MNLFKTEKSINGQFITLARALTLDDVNIKESNSSAPKADDSFKFTPSSLSETISVTLNEERIKELLEVTGTEVLDDGRYNRSGNSVSYVTDAWHSKAKAFYASVEKPLSFRGLRTAEAKHKRHMEVHTELMAQFKEEKDALTENALKQLTEALIKVVTANNSDIEETLRNVVVKLSVKKEALAMCLNEQETRDVNAQAAEIDEIDAKIKELREQKSAKKDSIYNTQRQAVERQLTKDSGEMGLTVLAALKSETEDESSLDDIFFG